MVEDLKKVYSGVFIVFLVIAAVGLFFSISDLNGQYSIKGKSRKFIADAADFNNPLTGNAVEETTRSYGYVDAPYYGKAQDASTDSYGDYTKSEITQVYEINRGQARIKPVLEQPVVPTLPLKTAYTPVYDGGKLVINDLEDLKKLICPSYNVEKPIQKIESMGGKSRRFIADAG